MKHVPHSTFATSIQKIHTMKADISITKSRKGTEIVVSGKRINKYGIIAAIVFAVPMLILFQSIHGETTSHLSLVRFFMCILAAVLVNLFLHKLLFRLFSPIRMWQYRTTCLLPFLLLGILPLIYEWQLWCHTIWNITGCHEFRWPLHPLAITLIRWRLLYYWQIRRIEFPRVVNLYSLNRKVECKFTEAPLFTFHFYPAAMCQHHLLYIIQAQTKTCSTAPSTSPDCCRTFKTVEDKRLVF